MWLAPIFILHEIEIAELPEASSAEDQFVIAHALVEPSVFSQSFLVPNKVVSKPL